jgi:hypothetical protein
MYASEAQHFPSFFSIPLELLHILIYKYLSLLCLVLAQLPVPHSLEAHSASLPLKSAVCRLCARSYLY